MSTPVSNSTPYVTAAQFLQRFDVRVVEDLVTDGKHRPTITELLDSSNLFGAKLYAALQDASGDIEAACLVGGRYVPADLAALTGNQAALLKRLVSTLAMDYLAQRRCDPTHQVSVQVQQTKNFLDALAGGDRIFGLQEVIDASHAEIEVDLDTDVEARNMTTYIAERFFGRRGNRYKT